MAPSRLDTSSHYLQWLHGKLLCGSAYLLLERLWCDRLIYWYTRIYWMVLGGSEKISQLKGILATLPWVPQVFFHPLGISLLVSRMGTPNSLWSQNKVIPIATKSTSSRVLTMRPWIPGPSTLPNLKGLLCLKKTTDFHSTTLQAFLSVQKSQNDTLTIALKSPNMLQETKKESNND